MQLPSILPIDVYTILQTRLQEKFAGIASVSLTIKCENAYISDELIKQYWTNVLKELSDISPPLKDCLQKQQPEWNGQMIQLICGHELELRTFKNKYIEITRKYL